MMQALRLAARAREFEEFPIGCVVVNQNRIIGKGFNQVKMSNDPTVHAEILAIIDAAQTLKNWSLENCTLYVTLESCPMCAGAIVNSHISRVVFGISDELLGACGTQSDLLTNNVFNRSIEIEKGVLADEYLALMRVYFQEQSRCKKNEEDNGYPSYAYFKKLFSTNEK
ncbi:MAG: nucleoside deaminase [Candidatus Latescibacteria bacterium]|nr:nucleoside deaminase [Candidatus Latescibacterota bacterium]